MCLKLVEMNCKFPLFSFISPRYGDHMYVRNQSKTYPWHALLLVVLSYVLFEFFLSRYVKSALNAILYSIYWFCLSIILIIALKNSLKISFYVPSYGLFMPLSIIMAIFQISLFVIFGLLVSGFGYSPYSHNPMGIAFNIVSFFFLIIAIELVRYFMLGRFRQPSFWLMTITLIVTTMISLHIYSALKVIDSVPSLMEFLGSNVLVTLTENILATYIFLRGGPISAILYRLTLASFEYFSPLLPDLSWTTKSFLFFISSMINFIIVEKATSQTHYGNRGEKNSLSPLISVTIIMIIIWFSLGFLGVYPTVIISGSMSPLIKPGDLVIIAKVPYYRIHVGDIIQFWDGEEFVVHRVIDIKRYKNTLFFITKGDANNAPDLDPVHQSNVMGKLILVIPKIGWLSIIAKQVTWKAYSIARENLSVFLIAVTMIALISYFLKVKLGKVSRRLKRRRLYRRLSF